MKTPRLTKHLRSCKGLFALILLTIFCTFSIGPAMAHRVTIFAWVEGDRIFTESKFSGGKLVKEGEVIVYDLKGTQLFKGKTDDKGEFSFEIPKRTSLKIVLIAGMGHRGEWTIPVSELEDVAGPQTEITTSQKTVPKKAEDQEETCDITLGDIRQIVEQALDKRLKPIMKILVESRENRPTFRDIVGGIGYILGLVGVAAYFNYRRKSAEIEGKKTD